MSIRRLLFVLGYLAIVFGAVLCTRSANEKPNESTNALVRYDTLQVRGRDIFDTCNNRLVLRGPETAPWDYYNDGGNPNRDPLYLPGIIRTTGANAMRAFFNIAPADSNCTHCDLDFVDKYLQNTTDAGLVTFVMVFYDTWLPDGGHCCDQPTCQPRTLCPPAQTCDVNSGLCRHPYTEWFTQPANKGVLDKYKKWLIIDSNNERNSLTREAWRDESIADITTLRDAGYMEPITTISLEAGRDLPAILQYGKYIEHQDPLQKTIFGWQAYWGVWDCAPDAGQTCTAHDNLPCCAFDCPATAGFYQESNPLGTLAPYGGQWGLADTTSIVNGTDVASDAGFPIYIGHNYEANGGSITDYRNMFAEAYLTNTSWLWWIFVLPPEGAIYHDSIVDEAHSIIDQDPNDNWANCHGHIGQLWNVCADDAGVVLDTSDPNPQNWFCRPTFPYGPTVLTYMDAGTNRACGL